MGFLIRVLINALAIYFAAAIVPGIELSGIMAALGSGLVLGLVNAVVRPILILMTLPFTLLTLGLFLRAQWTLSMAHIITRQRVRGPRFLGGCLWVLLVSVVSWLLTTSVSDRGQIMVIRHWRGGGPGSMHDTAPGMGQPRPTKGILVAMIVMNRTVSNGSSAMWSTACDMLHIHHRFDRQRAIALAPS